MKKIIHFSLANTRSGITQYVLNHWKYIDKSSFQFDVVTFGGKLDFQEELEVQGCKVFYVKNRAEDDLEQFRDEILRILSGGYDMIHLHTSYWKSFELEKLAKQAGIPRIIVHAHNTAVFDDKGREEKERQHYRLREQLFPDIATDFWACSYTAAQWLYADRIPSERIRIVNNAIDVRKFQFNQEKRRKIRQSLGWEDKLIVGHVGRFSYQKNHKFLIEAFGEAVKVREDIRLILIGRGPLEDSVYSLVDQSGLAGKVCFAGTSNHVNDWLQAMDVFALPSLFEGLPIVAVEAQAAGLRCLLGDTVTRETAVTDRISFLPLEICVWRDALLAEPGKEENREQYARQVAQAGYDIQKYIQTLEGMYGKDR